MTISLGLLFLGIFWSESHFLDIVLKFIQIRHVNEIKTNSKNLFAREGYLVVVDFS